MRAEHVPEPTVTAPASPLRESPPSFDASAATPQMIPSALLDFDAVSDDQDEIFIQESEERGNRSIDKSMFETYARLPARFVVDVAAYVKILAAFTISVGTTMSGSEILMEACDSLSHVWAITYGVRVHFRHLFSCENDARVRVFIRHRFLEGLRRTCRPTK